MKNGGRKFRAAVQAEIERRRALAPIFLRKVTVDFEDRTVTIDDRDPFTVTGRAFTIPILTTDQVVLPR